ncbi:unnamed protein product [Rodentolepis nana]|uniref:Transposase n=1 Tax=Rodentolepis nana TaxID=102285 RepID=A0A0R3TMH8_RODNA|nr:unnamed protein product [Rodentolepis nana]
MRDSNPDENTLVVDEGDYPEIADPRRWLPTTQSDSRFPMLIISRCNCELGDLYEIGCTF